MDTETRIQLIDEESARLIDAIAAAPDGAIPHCGDWTNRVLGSHVGAVWGFATANVLAATDTPTRASEDLALPEDPDELVGWLGRCRQVMLDALTGAEPASVAWSFAPDNQTAGFWQRRMVHETTVHRVDAQVGAAGAVDPIDPGVAADGIDEYTAVGLRFSSGRPNRTYPARSLHLHCTDTEGEWMLVGDDGSSVAVTKEHGKGDAAVRGRAEDVLLWIWGRPSGDLEIFGDPEVAGTWQSLAP